MIPIGDFFHGLRSQSPFANKKKFAFPLHLRSPIFQQARLFKITPYRNEKIATSFFFGSRPNSSPNLLENFWSPFFSRQGTGPNAIWIHYLCAQAITNGNPVVCGPRVEKDHLQLAIFGDFFSMGSLPCRKETTTGLPTIHLFRGLLS